MSKGYHKRKLPHIQIDNMYNFITFRTYKSVDDYVKKISGLNTNSKIKQYQIDKYLDNSDNGSYFYKSQIKIMKSVLFSYDGIDYKLLCFTIMPNHIHILIKPNAKLATIMKNIKGKSAKLLNENLNLSGKFWCREYYDKVLRDEHQLETTINYILNNPIKANLNDYEERNYIRHL